jgi:hypothetical protein
VSYLSSPLPCVLSLLSCAHSPIPSDQGLLKTPFCHQQNHYKSSGGDQSLTLEAWSFSLFLALRRAGHVSDWEVKIQGPVFPSGSGAKLQLGVRTKPLLGQAKELKPVLGQSQDPETIAMSHQLALVPGICAAAARTRLGLQTVTVPAPHLGLPVSALIRLTPNALCTLASACF